MAARRRTIFVISAQWALTFAFIDLSMRAMTLIYLLTLIICIFSERVYKDAETHDCETLRVHDGGHFLQSEIVVLHRKSGTTTPSSTVHRWKSKKKWLQMKLANIRLFQTKTHVRCMNGERSLFCHVYKLIWHITWNTESINTPKVQHHLHHQHFISTSCFLYQITPLWVKMPWIYFADVKHDM